MAKIDFYYNPMSRARIVHWMLEEISEPYEIKLLELEKKEHKSPEYLKLNPMGKVPTIVHDGVVVTECPAICAYLADAFPQKNLAPKSDNHRERAAYFRWLFFAAGPLEAATTDRVFPRLEAARPGVLGYGTYQDTLNALETAVTPGPFITGDTFTAADVYVGSQIGWGLLMKTIEPRPAFTRYVETLSARPAWKRISALADEYAAKLKKG